MPHKHNADSIRLHITTDVPGGAPRCLGGARITIIGSFPRMPMRFDQLRSGHYRATTGETPHRWFYDITRVTRRVWRVAQIRLQRGCDIIVVDTRAVATLKSGMQWCENAARNEEGSMQPE
jgi:hypothetical protein